MERVKEAQTGQVLLVILAGSVGLQKSLRWALCLPSHAPGIGGGRQPLPSNRPLHLLHSQVLQQDSRARAYLQTAGSACLSQPQCPGLQTWSRLCFLPLLVLPSSRRQPESCPLQDARGPDFDSTMVSPGLLVFGPGAHCSSLMLFWSI